MLMWSSLSGFNIRKCLFTTWRVLPRTNVKYWPSVTGSNIYKSRYRIHVFRTSSSLPSYRHCHRKEVCNGCNLQLSYLSLFHFIPITLWNRILPRSGFGSVSPEMTSSKSMSLSPLRKSSSMLSMAVPAFLRWLLHQAVKVCKLKINK